MNHIDIILDTLKTEDIQLYEGAFPISPFLAYVSFKEKIFNSLKSNGFVKFVTDTATGKTVSKIKGGIAIGKEKAMSDIGLNSGTDKNATVYRLLPEQTRVMAEVYQKYGDVLVDEIYKFRRNVLAPYQAIKRVVRENKQVSFKDVNGMSYDEFKDALESGRKKILKRKDFFSGQDDKFELMDKYKENIEKIESAIKVLKSGAKIEIMDSVLNSIYNKLELEDFALQGYSQEELKRITDEIAKNSKLIASYSNENDKISTQDLIDAVRSNLKLSSGEKSNEEKYKEKKEEKDTEKTKKEVKGSLKAAINKYLMRQNIRDSIKADGENIYKKMYLKNLEELKKNYSERKSEILSSATSSTMAVEFNDKEKKIWEKLPSIKSDYTGKLEDYHQKIVDSEFREVQHIKKPESLLRAQQDIENEIKRFERKVAEIVEPNDLAKLKKFRLINNLIAIKELKDPATLFKSTEEIRAEVPSPSKEEKEPEENAPIPKDEEDEEAKGYIGEGEFHRRLEELATMEFDTAMELSNSKKQVEELIQKMKRQGDDKILKKYENIIEQIKNRRTTEKVKITGNANVYGEVISIGDVEDFAKNMIKKRYSSVDEMKQDKIIFDKMMSKYKEEDPEASRNISEIEFLLSQVDRKFKGELGRIATAAEDKIEKTEDKK